MKNISDNIISISKKQWLPPVLYYFLIILAYPVGIFCLLTRKNLNNYVEVAYKINGFIFTEIKYNQQSKIIINKYINGNDNK